MSTPEATLIFLCFGERFYSVMDLENWPVTWLRLIASEERMKELGQALLAALICSSLLLAALDARAARRPFH